MKKVGTKQLETERLLLRKVKESDADEAFKNWCNNPNVSRYTLWDTHKTVDTVKVLFKLWEDAYEQKDTFRWGVVIKSTNTLIGTIDVASKDWLKYGTAEIGYCYGEEFWHKGYATEALKRVIKYLFDEADLDLIYATYMENNPNSGKVMKSAGMKYEGFVRERVVDHDGKRNNLHSYSITKKEYLENKEFYN